MQKENLKIIFGLKLRQYRQQKGLSTKQVAHNAGLSTSYVNEIEKGKKYPKADKIVSLAEALSVSYDELVSLKLGKSLNRLSTLLNSDTLQDIPFHLFGIEMSDLMGIMSDDPARFSALISTFLEIARNYDVRVEQFLFAALRSYQELHNNYFEDLEEAVEKFCERHEWAKEDPVPYNRLVDYLTKAYSYIIEESSFENYPDLKGFRSIYVPGKPPRLIINEHLLESQKAFVLGREIGYNELNLKERALTSSWLQVDSFEQVLNNFKASYFAGALLLKTSDLNKRLHQFFQRKKFDADALGQMMDDFKATPEMFAHRITQVLPHHFDLDQLFFLRFNNTTHSEKYFLTKELHLSRLHNPHGVAHSEHYCRRWITISLLQDLARKIRIGTYEKPIIGAQFSHYHNTNSEYLCITIARPLSLASDNNSCVTLGIEVNDAFKEKVGFWNDSDIPRRTVNETCERCPIEDCDERAAEPVFYEEEQKKERRVMALHQLMDDYSQKSSDPNAMEEA